MVTRRKFQDPRKLVYRDGCSLNHLAKEQSRLRAEGAVRLLEPKASPSFVGLAPKCCETEDGRKTQGAWLP
jgi:hypothetical protein